MALGRMGSARFMSNMCGPRWESRATSLEAATGKARAKDGGAAAAGGASAQESAAAGEAAAAEVVHSAVLGAY